ncbi:MAG: sulfatase-like hydrolase/transferase [Myxococcota bacterium]
MATPNILIILADDIGVDAFRVDPQAKTVSAHVIGPSDTAGPVALPNFGRLVESGVHFQHAWAHPVCTPTRASLWTGMQAWKTTLGYPTGGGDDLPAQTVDGETIRTLAQTLKAGADYRCAMFGKWDLGLPPTPTNSDRTGKTPVQWGWDHFAGVFRGGLRQDGIQQYGFPPPTSRVGWDRLQNATSSSQPAKCAAATEALKSQYNEEFLQNNPDLRFFIWEKDTIADDGTANDPLGPQERVRQGQRLYATEDQIEDTKRWITDNASKGPWCVALSLITPHDPLHVPPPRSFRPSTITEPTEPTSQEMLVAMLESMDHYLGDLLHHIDDELDNTVVIFVGDNGTQDIDPDSGASIDERIGDDKSTESVGGVHIPMLVADGGLMKGGEACYLQAAPRSVGGPVHIIDVYNTVLDIAGVTPPDNDSISIASQLRAEPGPRREHNFSQMYTALSQGRGRAAASACDAAYEYKLTCKLLATSLGAFRDRSGAPSSTPVFDYIFSRLEPETTTKNEEIPGSYVERPISGVLELNADGSYEIVDPTHQAKILELYRVLSREYLHSDKIVFPPIGTSWTLVFKHDISGGLFTDNAEAQQVNADADPTSVTKYSRLDELESMRGADGKLHFKLVYPEVPDRFNEWKQSSNPVTTTERVDGYEAVDISWTDNHWGGLARSSEAHTFIDGSVGHGNWWYSIGSNTAYGDHKVPGPNSTPVDRVELYVKGDFPRWTLVFKHDVSGGFFSGDAEALQTNDNADPASVAKYSRLHELEDMRGADGKLHFRLVYPGVPGQVNEWKQSSNPATTTERVDGYEAVDISWTDNHWGGLARSSRAETFIDGSVGHGNWWYSIGSNIAYGNDQVPGPNSTPVDRVELYVKRG